RATVDARNRIDRAVRVGRRDDITLCVTISKRNSALVFQPFSRFFIDLIASFGMSDWNANDGGNSVGERSPPCCLQKHIATFESSMGIAGERSGEKSRFSEYLKTVADPQDKATAFRVPLDVHHD